MRHKTFMVFMVVSVLTISLFFYVKPSFSRTFHQKYTETTELKRENINGLYLYDNINEPRFKNKYGDAKEKSVLGGHLYYRIQKGLEVAADSKGNILRIAVNEPKLKTARDIQVGDYNTKIKKAYGDHYYERTEQGATIIGYVDHKYHQSIEFWLVRERVGEIRFDDTSLK